MEKDMLRNMGDDSKKELLDLMCKLLDKKVNMEVKEIVAEITKLIDKKYAEQILGLLKNNVKGDAEKVYLEAIKQWEIED